ATDVQGHLDLDEGARVVREGDARTREPDAPVEALGPFVPFGDVQADLRTSPVARAANCGLDQGVGDTLAPRRGVHPHGDELTDGRIAVADDDREHPERVAVAFPDEVRVP